MHQPFKKILSATGRFLLKALGFVIILVIVLPFTLYIPFVQNWVKDYACNYVSENTDMDVKCDRILLEFPLDVSVDGLSVVQKGDTMVRVSNLTTGVEFLPLLKLDVKIGDARLTNGYYHLLTTDSATDLTAQVDMCHLTGTDVDLDHHTFNLLDGELEGGKIIFTSYPYKSKEEVDTSASTPWRINAYKLTVKKIDYTMRMLPTIDKLHAYVGQAQLVNGVIDTGERTVNARSLSVDSLDLKYYTLNDQDAALYDELHPVPPDTLPFDPNDTLSWTVQGDSVLLSKAHVLYAKRGVTPKRGLDTDYLELSQTNISLYDLFNRGSSVSVGVKQLSAKERCGLDIKSASGFIALDSTKIDVQDFHLKTFLSDFYVDVHAPFTLMNQPPYGSFTIKTDNKIALQEITMLYPSLKSTFNMIPQYNPLALKAEVVGTPDHLDIRSCTASIPRYLSATVSGKVDYPMDMNKLSGNVAFDAKLDNVNYFKPTLLDKATAKQINIPPMTLKGNAKFGGNNYSGNLAMRLASGSLVGNGAFHGNSQAYNVDATFKNFPVRSILPMAPIDHLTGHVVADGHGFDFNSPSTAVKANADLAFGSGSLRGRASYTGGSQSYDVDATLVNFPVRTFYAASPVDNVSAKVVAKGHGFDFLSPKTSVVADVNLGSIIYDKRHFKDIVAHVKMDGGKILANVDSKNPDCDLYLNADGRIEGTRYIFALNGNIRDLNTKALGFTDFACNGSGEISGYVDYDTRTNHCDMNADLHNINWNYDGTQLASDNTQLRFLSNDSVVEAYLDNEDTHVNFVSQCSLNEFMKYLNSSMAVAQNQIKKHALDVNALQEALPKFELEMKLGPSGLVPRLLAGYDIDVRDLDCVIKNDSTLYMDGYVHQFSMGTTSIDTLTFHANELKNKYLAFNVHMGNRKGTWDEFAQVDIRGGAKDSTVDFLVEQRNIKKEMGYRLGMNATLTGNNIKTRLFPSNPVIGYRDWELNDSNYVNFNYVTRMLDADLTMKSGNSTFVLNTEPSSEPGKEYINLDVDNLVLEDWLMKLPNMPEVSGVANADMKVLFDGTNFDGNGKVDLKNFVYEGREVGDLGLNTDLDYDPATSSTKLNATIDMDGSKVALAYGSFTNDTTETTPLDVKLQLDKFPLHKASPFIPGNMIDFDGFANGELTVTGTTENYNINGYVQGDSASVLLPTYGCSIALSNDRINVDNGLIGFNGYKVYGLNQKAALVDGSVNINTMDIALRVEGKNIQVIGSDQTSESQVFGKGFTDLSMTILSNETNMDINGKVSLLSGSNLTYVMQDEVDALTNSSTIDENMVTFINPNDSTGEDVVLKTAQGTTSTNINLDLEVQEGCKLGAYLSTDGKDRVTVDGSGRLRYSLDFAGKDNLVGTYTIENGNVRYTPPIISQKIFDITSGSKITWTGEMLNPQLDISGTEKVKASVTSDGTSKLIEFLVTAKIASTLKNMDIKFDLSTTSDMTIQNELQSMTDVQRSNTAMNLLLYNTYSGGDSGNMNLSASSALFSFLQSQINSWAASAIKGVDLTFGINEYKSGNADATSTQTSYSYRLSKNLFNDRFKIVVGGEYSTEASKEQNFSNNLINDISLEYNLNATGTKYVRVFRHTGWKNVLEGEITEMGVGFVMKKKAPTLRLLWGKPKKAPVAVQTDSTQTETKVETEKQQNANEK